MPNCHGEFDQFGARFDPELDDGSDYYLADFELIERKYGKSFAS
jgi:hypothetical protein